jgi:ribose-phosphate pyrophosphokinase
MIKILYPTINGPALVTAKFITFSGGEEHVHLNNKYELLMKQPINIYAQILSSKEVMQLLLATDALRHLYPNVDIELYIPYIPYARQDRVCFPGDAFSLNVFADLINAQEYSQVVVVDAHSKVALNLINNVLEIPQHTFVRNIASRLSRTDRVDSLISPDKGATDKTRQFMDRWPDHIAIPPKQLVQGGKRRDETGKIVETTLEYLNNSHAPLGNCLIIDDICDGGRTFIELAKVLYAHGAADVYLFVTHGIFSQGLQVLKDNGISKVFTTDTFPEKDDGRIVVKRFFY